MDFKDQIMLLVDRIDKLKDNLQTEEATKNALIMPFIGALGYDVFNPLEVVPEFNCDIGTKKGEKIDYAIFKDSEPVILVECKHWQQDLNLHDNQLLRYFNVSKAKFGLLTNGIVYRFYTDLESPNKMDEKPFLEVNLLDLRANQIEELKKFHKTYFDMNNILSSASELKYTSELKGVISREFANPSPDFVRLFARQVYDGQIKLSVLEQFTGLVKKSIAGLISDIIADRLKTALKTETAESQQPLEDTTTKSAETVENLIETTTEELEAFYIIKAILRSVLPIERIAYRDAQSYFTVLVDNNNRKPVCRLYFNSPTNKRITFIDENRKEQHKKINSLDDIYNYSDNIIAAAEKYV
jgi:hypothetical protein